MVEILSAEKVFPNGTRALAPIDLTIAAGEFLTLIGPSGCGKSTLLKLIANLIEPSDGRILWWSGAFDKVGSSGRSLAFVFQDPTLMPWARVEANVRLPLDLARMPKAESSKRVAEALSRVGLEGFARHYPRQLSGGMKMRVSIARSLATEPDLLLMDEPFGALDEFTRNRLDADLVRLWWERKLTTRLRHPFDLRGGVSVDPRRRHGRAARPYLQGHDDRRAASARRELPQFARASPSIAARCRRALTEVSLQQMQRVSDEDRSRCVRSRSPKPQ